MQKPCRTILSPFRIGLAATVLALALVVARAQTNVALTTIYTFSPRVSSTNSDGVFPRAGLVEGSDGFYYGTTYNGGLYGWGTIYRISPSGGFATVAHFTGTDGYSCTAPLVQASDGTFYGTAMGGGANFYGTVFKVTTNGTLTRLWSFTGGIDGSYPAAGLVLGADRALYGTTPNGGARGFGTVFKITTNGLFTTLVTFGNTNGATPSGPLLQLQDDNGNFLGTTEKGGSVGAGTVFKMAPSGALIFSASFGYTNGFDPVCGLVRGADGSFYGTTRYGGPGNGTNGYGSVFRITPAGQLTTVAFFNNTNGGMPTAGLMLTRNGQLYGISNFSAYRLMADGTLAGIAMFTPVGYQFPYGIFPHGTLLEGKGGVLYGVAEQGGTNTSQGLIYRLDLQPSLGTPKTANGNFSLSWGAIPGQRYQLQYSSDLKNWINLGDPLPGVGAPLGASDVAPSDPQRCYRVLLLP